MMKPANWLFSSYKSSFPYLCALLAQGSLPPRGHSQTALGPWTSPFLAPRMPSQAHLFTVPLLYTIFSQAQIPYSISVLFRVLQRNRTNLIDDIDVAIDTDVEEMYYKNWLMRLWRLRRPTVCHLQAGGPGSQWCNSVQGWKPENQELRCKRAGKERPPGSRRGNSPFLHLFLLCLGPQWIGWCSPTLVRAGLLYSVCCIKC